MRFCSIVVPFYNSSMNMVVPCRYLRQQCLNRLILIEILKGSKSPQCLEIGVITDDLHTLYGHAVR
jgi:hypothetical protein